MSRRSDITDAMRRKVLADIASRLSEEERAVLSGRTRPDVLLDSLHRQEDAIERISKRGWLWNFSSNVAGNAAYNAGTFILGKVARLLLK